MRSFVVFSFTLLVSSSAFAHGMSEADRIRAEQGGFWDFFPLGAVHMLTGYDHLLFLFGVVFFLTKFKDILKFITAFTVGHSITLIAATFLGIQANYFLVDAVIALTVCYKGFDNVNGFQKYLGMQSPNLLTAVFIFGLIHGFGLSTRLQQLTIGEGMDLLVKIIAFNVGVEAGQVAALAVILVLLSTWRHTESFARFSTAANVLLIIVGAMLFNMQIHGYSHQANPDDFGFPKDAHSHAHAEMYQERIADDSPPPAQGLEGMLQTLGEDADTEPEEPSPSSETETDAGAQTGEAETDNPQRPWSRPEQ